MNENQPMFTFALPFFAHHWYFSPHFQPLSAFGWRNVFDFTNKFPDFSPSLTIANDIPDFFLTLKNFRFSLTFPWRWQFVGFIPGSLVLRSIAYSWILKYRNLPILKDVRSTKQMRMTLLVKSKKGEVTLFNVGSSFSYETGINGSRRCALYSPASVSAPFYGYSKLWLHGSEESRSRGWSHWRSNQTPLAQKAAH